MKTMASLVLMLILGGIAACAADDADKAAKKDQKAKKPPVYDEKADAAAQIDAALAAARRENRRVLIQWGGNWCSWCILLHDRFQTDRDVSRLLKYEYDVVYVDIGKMDKNRELFRKYKADLSKHGVPYLTVLDADGKVLANQATDPFETKDDDGAKGHDPKKIVEFLKTHQAKPLDADDVLKAALATAAKSDRVVFLHFGAPWCGWCHRLDDWLLRPEIAKILGQDYLDVKIDVDRMTHGKEVLTHYRESDKGGIPWFVMVNAEGKELATSDDPKAKGVNKNIGFPATTEEIAHFVTMLKATKKRMTDKDIEAVAASLEPAKK